MAGLYHDLCMNYILLSGSVCNLEAADIPDVLKSAEHVHVSPMLYINMDWNIDQQFDLPAISLSVQILHHFFYLIKCDWLLENNPLHVQSVKAFLLHLT